jgi:hypothetical protein
MQIQIDNEEDFYHLISEYQPTEFFHKAFSMEIPYLVITTFKYNTVDYEIRSKIIREYRNQPLGFLFHFMNQHILEMWFFEIPNEDTGTVTSAEEGFNAVAAKRHQ